MVLSEKDLGYLRYIERWTTYKAAEGVLSLEQVIRKDDGRYFSSIISEDDKYVKSFAMQNIPEADGMLVFGYPRVLAYAAEIAIRYRDKYGDYPELFTVGDGRGMFSQRRKMDMWFSQQLVALGFPPKWAFKNNHGHDVKNRNYVEDVQALVKHIIVPKRRFRLLAVTGVGCSLSAAQELCAAMPYAELFVFEAPQPDNRYFDSELFTPKSYAVDALLAQFVRCRMAAGDVRLPVEKLLEIPRMEPIRDLLLRGYAGCMVSSEMWKTVGICLATGVQLHKERIAQLQRVIRPNRFEKQTRRLLDEIRRNLIKKDLVI